MERKGIRSTIYIGRASLHGCLLGLLSSHSLAQNNCGHISNISADHVRRGKGWMLSLDAFAIADGENPLSARPNQGSPPFSLTKPVRLPSSLRRCLWADPASRRPPIHIRTTFRYIFGRNRLSSTSPARYVAACA